MSIDVASGGTAPSAGLVAAGASPDASHQASNAAYQRPVEAVSTHYMALGRAATRGRVPVGTDSSGCRPLGGLPRILDAAGRLAAGGRSHIGPPPSGRLEQGFSLRRWYGSRTRDSQIHGLVLYPLS